MALLALFSGCLLAAAVEYFTPRHQLLGIGAGRSDMTAELLAARTDRMIQSQTFTIMRDPQAIAGAERITGARLAPIFRRAADESGWPVSLISAVAFLESWGDAQATSPAGPRGIMQFSEATARAAGLRIVRVTRFQVTTSHQLVRRRSGQKGKSVYRTVRHKMPYAVTVRDDRLNPERAATAAARYLARMETKFGGRDWAIFAYHCGEGCVSDLLPLTEAAVHHKQPSVAEMFFAANPARHAELYQALQREMQRDYSPTYWFRIQARGAVAGVISGGPGGLPRTRRRVSESDSSEAPRRRPFDGLAEVARHLLSLTGRLATWLPEQPSLRFSTIPNSSDSRCRRWPTAPIEISTCRIRRPLSEPCSMWRLRRAGFLRSSTPRASISCPCEWRNWWAQPTVPRRPARCGGSGISGTFHRSGVRYRPLQPAARRARVPELHARRHGLGRLPRFHSGDRRHGAHWMLAVIPRILRVCF